MATRTEPLSTWVARALSTYSLLVYAAGLVVIGLSRVVEGSAAFPFPPRLRQAVVVVTLAVMAVTYLAERRFGYGREDEDGGEAADDVPGTDPDAPETGDDAPEYSLYARVSMAAAAVGVAAGIYVALAMDRPFVGGLFVLGAYLFVHMAYRRDEGEVD